MPRWSQRRCDPRLEVAGDTPLHLAWKHDSPVVIDRLLALGADARAPNDLGMVPGPVCDWSTLALPSDCTTN